MLEIIHLLQIDGTRVICRNPRCREINHDGRLSIQTIPVRSREVSPDVLQPMGAVLVFIGTYRSRLRGIAA